MDELFLFLYFKVFGDGGKVVGGFQHLGRCSRGVLRVFRGCSGVFLVYRHKTFQLNNSQTT